MPTKKLIGPFSEILTMANLPDKGGLHNEQLEIIENGYVLVENGKIIAINADIKKEKDFELEEITEPCVLLPGLIDAHTHICFAGSRALDYTDRVSGVPYLKIIERGGGIYDTVQKTRQASTTELLETLQKRCDRHLAEGVTTCEVKSGYGLDLANELKMLEVIHQTNKSHDIDLIATCLAAHICPKEFTPEKYLTYILQEILPIIKTKNLSKRVDIFVEEKAFDVIQARIFLKEAKKLGFDLTIHADQFSVGGSALACELNALSTDHLEASGEKEIQMLAQSNVVATVLPGASLGLGMSFAPARKMLDAGCCVAIASDWNPGSAPMGDLLMQAAIIGAFEKLSLAETWAGITFRAAKALNLVDRGKLIPQQLADMIAFPCKDYREILYHQGKMKPMYVWKEGKMI